MIDDEQLLAPKPDVDYKRLSAQPSPQDFLVLTRVKGVVSVGQLCSSSGLGREKTLAAIDVLLDVGLLHVVDADGKPIAPPANAADASRTHTAADPIAPLRRERHKTPHASEAVARSEPSVPEREPEPQPQADVLDPHDQTHVMSAMDVGFAMLPSEAALEFDAPSDEMEFEVEPLAMRSEPSFLTPESEAIAIEAPDEPEEPFEIDRQPIALRLEELMVPQQPPAPRPPAPTPEPDDMVIQQTSFDTLAPDDGDDDLFMPDSPAHLDRLTGKAPVKRDHHKSKAPAARPAAARAAAAPLKISSVNASSYRLFPVDFIRYESKHGRIVGVDDDVQHEIDFVFDHLEYVDFYQLFGVEPTADRKVIRTAYFEMSKRFHPDKFFRDDVGDMAERVGAIFRFVTKGYQTLSKKNNRAEYDEALQRARAAAVSDSAEDERKRGMAADMLERRAAQLEQQGQLAQAAAEYKKVASLRRDPRAFMKAASLLLRANQQLDEAASMARAAVRQLPLEVEPRLVLGQIYEKNQMLAEAERVFGEAEAIAPSDPSVRVHLERVRSQI